MSAEMVLPDLDTPLRFQGLLESFRERLDRELLRWLESRGREVEPVAGAADLDQRLVDFITRGGKRLRPAQVHFAFRACGGRDPDLVMPLAMAVELLHTYLLIHDDIMDRAETRRGDPAVHVEFQAVHQARGWRGASTHFGEAAATLAGDLAHTYAVELFGRAVEGSPAAGGLQACFHDMCREVIVGQYLELSVGYQEAPTAADLRLILQLKSARYSVERPIQLGALLAGAPPERLSALSQYGLAMGEAFQLQDDLLGMFGDTRVTGKPVGEDLREGKYTFLVYHALQEADEDDRKLVQAALGDAAVSADTVDRVCRLMIDTGARETVSSMVEERLKRAGSLVEGLELDGEGREFFTGLIDYLRGRSR